MLGFTRHRALCSSTAYSRSLLLALISVLAYAYVCVCVCVCALVEHNPAPKTSSNGSFLRQTSYLILSFAVLLFVTLLLPFARICARSCKTASTNVKLDCTRN
jgi:cell division protein FtsW (lipid II flippase)